jgi:hypothetical protein
VFLANKGYGSKEKRRPPYRMNATQTELMEALAGAAGELYISGHGLFSKEIGLIKNAIELVGKAWKLSAENRCDTSVELTELILKLRGAEPEEYSKLLNHRKDYGIIEALNETAAQLEQKADKEKVTDLALRLKDFWGLSEPTPHCGICEPSL